MLNNVSRNLLSYIKKCINLLVEPVIGYTRVVFATKFILSFIAFILICALITIPLVNPVHENFRLTVTDVELLNDQDSESPKMLNPRFQSVDKDNRTYNITAESAVKQGDQTLILNKINADINLKDGSWITLMANSGIFKLEDKLLDLIDSINIFTHDGYEFKTQVVHVNLSDGSAYGNSPVHAQGAIGNLTADSFIVEDRGDRIVLKGNVKVVIYRSPL